jgi:hypothetical protein
MIPASATICSHCLQRQTVEKRSPWKMIMGWVAAATALIGLLASLSGGVRWFVAQRTQKTQLDAAMAVARGEVNQGEYEAAMRSYGEILKENPLCNPAREGQVDAAMLWVENFQVTGEEDKGVTDIAGKKLDEIMPVLDAGLARSRVAGNPPRTADIEAHVGWAHWLNWHIAQREFGPSAEQELRAAVEMDGSNVYANAMLGNWMLQNNENFQEAMGHLKRAVATGRERPLVRNMELDGLLGEEVPGARAELVRAVNDMRKGGESLDGGEKHRILGFCYSPTLTDDATLTESLSAVPADDAWKTYLWVDDAPDQDAADQTKMLNREFIYASLLDVGGKRPEALEKYRVLQQELKGRPGRLKERVDDDVRRLSVG